MGLYFTLHFHSSSDGLKTMQNDKLKMFWIAFSAVQFGFRVTVTFFKSETEVDICL